MKSSEENPIDLVQPFQLETGSFRGRLVRLGPALDLILHQHAYPDAVGGLLGEAMVMAAALGTALKYEGVFTLQVKGDGPVKMLVADVTHDGGIRAYAQYGADDVKAQTAKANLRVVTPEGTLKASPGFNDSKLLGKGYLAFTCMLAGGKSGEDRYQGIVELEGGSLAEAVQHYFRQSEQLPTGIVAAARRDEHGRWQGGCLMLQQMPRTGGHSTRSVFAHDDDDGEGGDLALNDTAIGDSWHRAMLLMGTCTHEELTDPNLPPLDLLYRLFHEEGVRVFEPHSFRHQCRCSESRVAAMLGSLPRHEVEDLAIDGVVDVTCEFCNKNYKFDATQRAALFQQANDN